RRRTPILLDLGLATMVITPSETVRKQAIERFRLLPDRVVAVPEAAAPWLRAVPEAAAPWLRPVPVPPAPGPRPPAPYFLFLGTLEPRKNLDALLAAWREV